MGFGYECCVETWLAVAVRMFLFLADDVSMEPLNYWRLSQATGIPLYVVRSCVQETVLLYRLLLSTRVHVPFAFKGIGVLTCEDNLLCMRFYHSCVTALEGTASMLAFVVSVS